MKLTNGEKIILLMLSDLYENLEIKGELDPEFIKSAIFSQNLWGISWKYPGIPFEDEEIPEKVKEVVDILDMWSIIERSYQKLSEENKHQLQKNIKQPFQFPGFDGNNESEYMNIASFLINDLNRFHEFKGRSLNAHMPTLEMHHEILSKFKSIRRDLVAGTLSFEQLKLLLS